MKHRITYDHSINSKLINSKYLQTKVKYVVLVLEYYSQLLILS